VEGRVKADGEGIKVIEVSKKQKIIKKMQ